MFKPAVFVHRNQVLQSLCQELFCSAYSEQTREFVLPALAYGWNHFPFVELLHALLPVNHQNRSANQMGLQRHVTEGAVPVEPTLWLLCAVLMLCERHLGKIPLSDFLRHLLYQNFVKHVSSNV